MKKNILLALAVVGIASASCRKERTCECKTQATEVRTGFGAKTTVYNSSTKITVEKQKKKSFLYGTDCFSKQNTEHDSGGNGNSAYTTETTFVTTCELN